MPRYITQTSEVSKTLHTKAYSFALNSLSASATQIENTFQLGGTKNIKKVQLNSIVYPYQGPGIRYNDEKSMLFGASAYATVPYTPQHCFTQGGVDKQFSLSAWIKLPAMPMASSHIFWHGTEYGLQVDATGIVSLLVATSGENYLKRDSVETVTLEAWTQITAVYKPALADATDIALYINGVVCTYMDSSMGTFTTMTDSLASSYIGYNATDTYAEDCYFGDLVVWSTALTSYEVVTIYNAGLVKNIGAAPIAVSRYTYGDHALDTVEVITDVLGGHDAACTGTVAIESDAAGGGSANVVAGDQSGNLILSIQNIPELRSFATLQGSVLGQAFSQSGSFIVEFQGGVTPGIFESYPLAEQGNLLELNNAAIVSSLQVRLNYLGSDCTGEGTSVLPPVTWPGVVQCRFTIWYEEV